MALYHFARFEFDSATGELVRDGRRVRLRPQPARVLEHLLVRHGGLVSRAELRRSIWPDGTYVHFDYGLNSCIKQIRAALADSDPATDYIETLVKRGFRFVAHVERVARRVDRLSPIDLAAAIAPSSEEADRVTDDETRSPGFRGCPTSWS
jgi:DNA-binding winged helix-turn-helix (wHTH) protein